jgi:hypothetical protein
MLRWYERHREEILRKYHEKERPPTRYKTKWNAQKIRELVEGNGYLFLENEDWEYTPGISFRVARKEFPDRVKSVHLGQFQQMVRN